MIGSTNSNMAHGIEMDRKTFDEIRNASSKKEAVEVSGVAAMDSDIAQTIARGAETVDCISSFMGLLQKSDGKQGFDRNPDRGVVDYNYERRYVTLLPGSHVDAIRKDVGGRIKNSHYDKVCRQYGRYHPRGFVT